MQRLPPSRLAARSLAICLGRPPQCSCPLAIPSRSAKNICISKPSTPSRPHARTCETSSPRAPSSVVPAWGRAQPRRWPRRSRGCFATALACSALSFSRTSARMRSLARAARPRPALHRTCLSPTSTRDWQVLVRQRLRPQRQGVAAVRGPDQRCRPHARHARAARAERHRLRSRCRPRCVRAVRASCAAPARPRARARAPALYSSIIFRSVAALGA